ncbi:MAG: hypothetical protein JNM96_00045, partial [Bacteroidia bacterium]|nr:hypothetical protein [Bacteroidia bacterium]
MRYTFKYITIVLSAFLLFNCGNSEKLEEFDELDDDTKKAILQTKLSAQNVFNSLPDRGELLRLVAENKLEYDTEVLNNPENLK